MPSTKKGTLVWKGGLAFEGSGDSGFSVRFDTSATEGGGSGFSPMELTLLSHAACMSMDVVSILKKKRQDVTGIEVHTLGERTDDTPRVFTDITLEFVVRGRKVDPEAVARSIELSEIKYCSVGGMLKKSVNIKTTYRVEEET